MASPSAARRGRYSEKATPGSRDRMARNSPRISAGADGLVEPVEEARRLRVGLADGGLRAGEEIAAESGGFGAGIFEEPAREGDGLFLRVFELLVGGELLPFQIALGATEGGGRRCPYAFEGKARRHLPCRGRAG